MESHHFNPTICISYAITTESITPLFDIPLVLWQVSFKNRIHNLHYEKFLDGTVKCIEDEIPFDVPKGWAWTRLGNICPYGETNAVASTHISSDAWILDLEDIEKDTGKIIYFATKNERDSKSNKHSFKKGQLLYSKLRPYLNKVVIAPHDGYCTTEILPLELYGGISSYYMQIFLMSETFLSYVNLISYGLKMPRLGTNDGKKALIAIPPIKEQSEIVKKSNYLIAIINDLQLEKIQLLEVVNHTKRKILDLAIRGKLVPQDPNDEPASVLLERIRAEKEELIKQGKIKRDKKESIIFRSDDNSYYQNVGEEMKDISDELPFEIPDSWCWGKLKDIVIINPRNKLDDDMEVAFIPMPLIEEGYSGNHSFEIRKWQEIKSGFTHFKDGDVGIAKITPCFENRKSVVFKNLCNGYGAGTTELHVLRPYKDTILAEFLLIYAKTQRFIEDGKQTFSGAVGQQRIGKEYIETVYFPIPPLQEQQRIINHINNLFNYLNVIEAALS